MTEQDCIGDVEILRGLKSKFGQGQFRFQDVVELGNPDRAYAFMEEADEQGWIEGDEEGEYTLLPDVDPERVLTAALKTPAVTHKPLPPDSFQEWYRGTKFHLGAGGHIYWTSPRKSIKIRVTSGLEGVITKIEAARPLGGSFRVDEVGRVLIKDPDHDNEIISLGKVSKIQLDAIDRDPRDRVKPGYIWPSIYDGARYHFSPDVKGEGKIWFRNSDGTRRYAVTGHEDLVNPLLKFKPKGGSFRITETGRVLTLRYTLPLPEEARAQWEGLTDEERNIIKARETPGYVLQIPIFVMDFKGRIKLGLPADIHKAWEPEEREEFFAKLMSREGGEI